MRDDVRPKCLVVTHCYDYVVPVNRPAKSAFGLATVGPWIYPRLIEKGKFFETPPMAGPVQKKP